MTEQINNSVFHQYGKGIATIGHESLISEYVLVRD